MNSLLRKVGTEDIQGRTYIISIENILYTANSKLFRIIEVWYDKDIFLQT